MALRCRYYERKLPDPEEVVMAKVKQIAEMGAYCQLEEYNNIEGMILLSELSRRRIRSINKLIKVGRRECVVVIRVDREKGYIDLSKRRVSPEEVARCEERFARAKLVATILHQTAAKLGYQTDEELENLYMKTAWHFDRKQNKPGASYEMFRKLISNPELLDECDLDEKTKEILLEQVQLKLTPQAVKLRADIDVGCYGYEGIDAVKAALKAGLEAAGDLPVNINLIAPPVYYISATTLDRDAGLQQLTKVIEKVKEEIEAKSGGVFAIRLAPKVTEEPDEDQLKSALEQAAMENREIPGDSDDEDDEEGGAGEGGDGVKNGADDDDDAEND